MAAGTIVFAWPARVGLVEPLAAVELELEVAGVLELLETLLWLLLVCAAPVVAAAPVPAPVPALLVEGVLPAPVDVVPAAVPTDVGLPVVAPAELVPLGSVVPVPAVLGVDEALVGIGVAVGSVEPVTLGGVTGPVIVVSWSGSSVWVIESREDLRGDRARRWLVTLDDAAEVNGFEAEVLEALPAELAAADAALWPALEL